MRERSFAEVLFVFLKLGATSFGGPVAHLGYFQRELVARRRWLDEDARANVIADCQFLPGPASTQVGVSIGLMRAGYAGGLAAWTVFTLHLRSPSCCSALPGPLFTFAVDLGAIVDGAVGAVIGLRSICLPGLLL